MNQVVGDQRTSGKARRLVADRVAMGGITFVRLSVFNVELVPDFFR